MPVLLVPAAIIGYKVWQERQKKKAQDALDGQDGPETEVVIEGVDKDGNPVKSLDALRNTASSDETETWVSPNASFCSDEGESHVQHQQTGSINRVKQHLMSLRARNTQQHNSQEEDNLEPFPSSNLEPIVRINMIKTGSPADVAGLKENDLIMRFGNTTHAAENPLQEISQLVPDAANQGMAIEVVILRRGDEESRTLQLKPSEWDGNGLVGFHIIPC
eukprot:CAMPEP_0172457732 /NCGR_PEP_ID=MMETSP1065-20121228/23859_1 /TAXON_ID=265537 /ORGANISM="Amphiprora paludosa, Strain CCMP125" /LENGTH=218 /DNA_ID=CAMNT_0013211631 /DNA_START=47 /DNA_END=703 /DNA_ORIENTATION=+